MSKTAATMQSIKDTMLQMQFALIVALSQKILGIKETDVTLGEAYDRILAENQEWIAAAIVDGKITPTDAKEIIEGIKMFASFAGR